MDRRELRRKLDREEVGASLGGGLGGHLLLGDLARGEVVDLRDDFDRPVGDRVVHDGHHVVEVVELRMERSERALLREEGGGEPERVVPRVRADLRHRRVRVPEENSRRLARCGGAVPHLPERTMVHRVDGLGLAAVFVDRLGASVGVHHHVVHRRHVVETAALAVAPRLAVHRP